MSQFYSSSQYGRHGRRVHDDGARVRGYCRRTARADSIGRTHSTCIFVIVPPTCKSRSSIWQWTSGSSTECAATRHPGGLFFLDRGTRSTGASVRDTTSLFWTLHRSDQCDVSSGVTDRQVFAGPGHGRRRNPFLHLVSIPHLGFPHKLELAKVVHAWVAASEQPGTKTKIDAFHKEHGEPIQMLDADWKVGGSSVQGAIRQAHPGFAAFRAVLSGGVRITVDRRNEYCSIVGSSRQQIARSQ